MRGLAKAAGVSTDTLYHWFRGTTRPDIADLANLAGALAVRRWEIVAALDGEETVLPLNDATRRAFLDLVEEWADSRGLPKPRREHRTGTGV